MEDIPTHPSTEPAGASSMSVMERLTNVVAAPGELFDYLRQAKESHVNWLVPALIYMLVGWACSTVVFTQDWVKPQLLEVQEAGLQKQVEAGKMTEARAEQARDVLERYGTIGPMIAGYAGPLILGLAGPFLWGLILWLIGAKFMKGGFTYMKAVEVAGLTAVIAALGSIVKTLLILIQGSILASASPVLLIGDFDPANPLHAAAGWLDVMVIWSLAIKSMGVARLGQRSAAGVAAWVFGLYVVFAAVVLALSLLAQQLGGS